MRVRRLGPTMIFLTLACADGGGTDPTTVAVASVSVSPGLDTIAPGANVHLVATAKDASGQVLTGRTITWTSASPLISTVSAKGLAKGVAKGVAVGSATITASSEGISGSATVVVYRRVAAVHITPALDTIPPGGSAQLVATMKDAKGIILTGRPITWTSSSPTASTVSNLGVAGGVADGSATITATAEGVSGSAVVVVLTPVASVEITPVAPVLLPGQAVQLTAIPKDANGVPLQGRAVKWSTPDPAIAQLRGGPGRVLGRFLGTTTINATVEGKSGGTAFTVNPFPLGVPSGIEARWGSPCLVNTSGTAFCWGGHPPEPISSGLHFTAVNSTGGHGCGLTTPGLAYCWGVLGYGEVGDGTALERHRPVPVVGGHVFSRVAVGFDQTCGLTTAGVAYCWGNNDSGQLGTGTLNGSLVPVPVARGLTFTTLSVGFNYGCGLTAAGTAHCWGNNAHHEVGDGTNATRRLAPAAVAGGLLFTSLSAGEGISANTTCGIVSSGAAYCWGANGAGEVGDGTTTERVSPRAVTGGLTFLEVSPGGGQTCGITTGGAAYCWGANPFGGLGDGTTTPSLGPVAVSGGLSFSSITTGQHFACGLTTGGVAYCWGRNDSGQVGDGTTVNRLAPVKVAGQP